MGKPKNYMVESIIGTVCCCLPFGVAGIIFAAQVDGKWSQGDHDGARAAAATAKKLFIINIVVTVALNILLLICSVFYFFLLLGTMDAQQGGGL